jgi:hypothetical protein
MIRSTMSRLLHTATAAGFLIILGFPTGAQAQSGQTRFNRLPTTIKRHVREIRTLCKDLNEAFKVYSPMFGIDAIHLGRSPAIMVDNRNLCNDHMPGANCSNRGCDLIIWKQTPRKRWRKVFEEHLHRNFVSLDRNNNRLQLIVASVYAGRPECEPQPNKSYTSGESCDVLIRYRNGKWRWQRVR